MQALRNQVARLTRYTRSNRDSYLVLVLTNRRYLTAAVSLLVLFIIVGNAFGTTPIYTDEVIDGPVVAVPGPASLCSYNAGNAGQRSRITFIETTGTTCLTARQSCAVESAARANPDMDVYVYFNTKKPEDFHAVDRDEPGRVATCDVTDNLKQYHNIKFIFDDVIDYLAETRLAQHYADGKFKQKSWAFPVLNQLLGLLEVHESGGVYLDLDVMVLRPLRCLENTVSLDAINSGLETRAMVFDKKHPFPSFALNYIAGKLEAGKPTSSISMMLAEAFKEFCSTQTLSTSEFNCQSDTKLRVLGEQSFATIRGELFEELVSAQRKEAFSLNHLSRAYLILSDASRWTRRIPTSSMYASLARNYCPSTMLDVGRLKVAYGL